MNIAVIFAGGVGSRMRSRELPKQFLRIHGKPVIVRTVEHFQYHPEVDSIVVVCIAQWLDYCRSLLERHGLSKVAAVVPGGSNGQESRPASRRRARGWRSIDRADTRRGQASH